MMTPKKRVKKKTEEQTKPKSTVPLKKRKVVHENDELELPEWFKTSVQILLINFYQDGVAMLNNVQSDYEAVFKGKTIDPQEYNFPDWEAMLRSDQLKKHCVVYVEKRISYCKGFPLSRSAAISMIDGAYNIDPRHLKHDKQAETTTIKTSTTTKQQNSSECLSDNEKLEKGDKTGSVIQYAAKDTPRTTGTSVTVAAVININGPEEEKSEETQSSTKISSNFQSLNKISPLSKSITKPTKSLPARRLSEADKTLYEERYKNIEDIKAVNSSFKAAVQQPIIELEKQNETAVIIRPKVTNLQENDFFRRSDVPATWTNVIEVETDLPKPPEREVVLMPIQKPITENNNLKKTLGKVTPPPSKSEEVIFVKTLSERIKERHRNAKDSPRSNPDIELLSTSNSIHITTPNINSSNKSKEIRRMSATESPTDSSSNSSGNSSPNSDHIMNPQELQLRKWYLQRIRIPNTDLSDIKTSLGDVNEEDIIEDPRLTVGMRAKYLGFLLSKKNENTIIEEAPLIKYGESKSIPLERGEREKIPRRSSESSDSDVFIIDEPDTYGRKSTDSKKHQEAPKMSFTSGVVNMQNIKITIQNSTEIMDDKKEKTIEMHVPLRNAHQSHGYLINEEPIPKDDQTDQDMCYKKLLDGLTRKHRLNKDSIPPEKFISPNLLSQWDRIVKFDLKNCQNELVRELNIYEAKPYPFGSNYYLRSSLRMVEIDYRTNQQFSDPTDANGKKLLTNNDMLYFVDLAGSPGGVVEYFHKRQRFRNKGFGVTYRKRAYDVSKIPDAIPEFFEAFYGKLNSYSGDGSLFCKDTVDTFVKHVLDATEGNGVHIVTTIGNITKLVFDDRNDEKWKYQHLAQMFVGLRVLREGGNMAFKMFELKSCFTVGMVYLLYRCFKSVTISKLNIFAPTSSERAIICLGRRPKVEIDGVMEFLKECQKDLTDWYDAKINGLGFRSNRTIEELIPFSKLEENKEFMKYIRFSNDSIKENQIEELKACIKNLKTSDFKSIFTPTSFRSLVTRTTDLWQIPTSMMKKPKRQFLRSKIPAVVFSEMRILPECVEGVESILNEFNLYTIFSTQRNWRFVPVGNMSRNRGFYMGVNGSPYFFSMKIRRWVPVDSHNFRLPDKTLVFGEFVTLYENDNRPFGQIFTVIDGVYLAGESIQHLSYQERIAECSHFCTAASRNFFPRTAQLTVTKSFEFSQLPNFLDLVVPFSADDQRPEQLRIPAHIVYKLPTNFLSETASNYWLKPSGMLFFESDLDLPDACQILVNRVYWEWVPGMDIPLSKPNILLGALDDIIEECRPIGSVSARRITNFVNRYSKS